MHSKISQAARDMLFGIVDEPTTKAIRVSTPSLKQFQAYICLANNGWIVGYKVPATQEYDVRLTTAGLEAANDMGRIKPKPVKRGAKQVRVAIDASLLKEYTDACEELRVTRDIVASHYRGDPPTQNELETALSDREWCAARKNSAACRIADFITGSDISF